MTPALDDQTIKEQAIKDAERAKAARSSSTTAIYDIRSYDEWADELKRLRSEPGYEPVRLGFGTLDADMRGIIPGEVCGIAARTAVGKSWALATIEHAFAARTDAGSLTCSLEMPGAAWTERLIGIDTDEAPEVVERWAREGELGAHIGDFLDRMQNSLLLDESVALDELPTVFEEARGRLNVPLRLVSIDYLGLLTSQGKDTYERASAVGKGLKRIAKSEKVAIVVATQVSRAGGDGSEPISMAMLRDSGVLEESLDYLLACWRPGKAPNLSPPDAIDLRNVMRVALLKNRRGDEGRVVDLRFRDDSRKLYEPADEFSELL
jgi:replicative DNA helicase